MPPKWRLCHLSGQMRSWCISPTIRRNKWREKMHFLPLSSARAEIHWLLLGLPCREIYDRQLAFALQLALDGDVEGAKTTAQPKDEVVAKRAARGRFQYLKASYRAAILMLGLLFVPSCSCSAEAADLSCLPRRQDWLVRLFPSRWPSADRTVALDTDLLDNVTDGTLRLVIGVVSAGVLLLLFASGILPTLKIGDSKFKTGGLDLANGAGHWFHRWFPGTPGSRSSGQRNGQGSAPATTPATARAPA